MAAAPNSLCPGYIQVESFLEDNEYEAEEVFYVTLDMGNIEPTLVPSSSSYRLIVSFCSKVQNVCSEDTKRLDTPMPFLQLQGTILKGQHDMLLGTELIFTDNKGIKSSTRQPPLDASTTENHDWNKRSVVHVANTEQRIAFQEVTLVPKISKGKERAVDRDESVIIDFEGTSAPAQEGTAIQIERLTGLSAPVGRAPRRPKSVSASKGPPRPKRRASAQSINYEQLDQRDRSPTNDDNDMYMN